MEIDVKDVSERGGQPGRRQKKSLPPRTDDGRCIAMGGVVAPAGYKEPTGDSPPASECSNVFEDMRETEVERLNKTTSEKVALRHWTSDERINGYENEPSVWTRPTVEALLPYNRRRREGGATARARARARGGKEEKRPSRTALKQARAVKTGQVQLQRRAPRLPREHGGREGGVGGTVRHPSVRGWTRAPTSPLVAGLAWASAGCTPSCPAARQCPARSRQPAPETIQQWTAVQTVVWCGHPPLPKNWIRYWSKSLNCEYYFNILTNHTQRILPMG